MRTRKFCTTAPANRRRVDRIPVERNFCRLTVMLHWKINSLAEVIKKWAMRRDSRESNGLRLLSRGCRQVYPQGPGIIDKGRCRQGTEPEPCRLARPSKRRERRATAVAGAGLVLLLAGGALPAAGASPVFDELSCRAGLAARGVRASPLPALSDGDCGAEAPLRLTAVAGIPVRRPATTTCAVADALDRWVAQVVVPEAKRAFGAAPTAILIGTSYQCRTRNGAPGARLSEHAYAAALDLHGFDFAGRRELTVKPVRGLPKAEAGFLAAIRRNACSYFTTVLGPGSDAAHADHLHLDLRQRKRGYRICQ